MAYLIRTAANISVADKLSASWWMRVPDPGIYPSFPLNQIRICDVTDGGGSAFYFSLSVDPLVPQMYATCSDGSRTFGFQSTLPSPFFGQWHHFGVWIDCSAGNPAPWLVYVNAVQKNTGVEAFNQTGTGGAITIPFLGSTFGFNGNPLNRFSGYVAEFSDFQFWAGQVIDFSNPLIFPKFVTVSSGHGTPTDPSIAAASFGLQGILFKGDKDHFWTNSGSGGAFTKIGTIADFTPTPSY